jgi:ubiquinone biosynthesis monooxygenase Coq7
MRELSFVDRLIMNFDQGLRTVFGQPQITERSNPAEIIPETDLSENEKQLAARLMRINHTGEVCAQALYQGQALTAKTAAVHQSMQRAAQEENDHLEWCETRLKEFNDHKSFLNPFWYVGSFAMGAMAGIAGDKWSLGFVAETERQVVKHLDDHLKRLPINDKKSRAILEQMKIDEKHHATEAIKAGGAPLPEGIKFAMRQTSKIMTSTVYWI